MLSISTPDVYAKDSECEYSDVVFRTHPDQEGEPTLVSVGLFLIDISNVNDTDQSFMANISIRITWKDPRLARAQHDHETVCVVELAKVWNPQVRIQNERAVWKRLADVVEIEADGTVTYTQRFNGTYASVGDIKQFPFDTRVLSFTFVSVGYSADEIILVADDGWRGRSEILSIPNWEIGQQKTSTGEYTVPGDKKFAKIDFEFIAERGSSYYIWTMIVPLLLIVFMSWSVFWINPQHFGAQLGVSTTSMLTLIAFRFTLRTILPPVAYLTSMDIFLTGSSILIFIALVETVATSVLAERGRNGLAMHIDRWSKILFPFMLILVAMLTVWW